MATIGLVYISALGDWQVMYGVHASAYHYTVGTDPVSFGRARVSGKAFRFVKFDEDELEDWEDEDGSLDETDLLYYAKNQPVDCCRYLDAHLAVEID